MTRNSRENKKAFVRQLNIPGATVTDRSTLLLGLEHSWMQLNARFTGYDKRAVLNNSGRTEAAVLLKR